MSREFVTATAKYGIDMQVEGMVVAFAYSDESTVGECGAPPAPPALANAIFAATDRRLRSMPFRLHGISFA